ncbi:hypothetical protein D3C86_2183000 [compost metagenome]
MTEIGAGRDVYEGQDRTDDLREYHLALVYEMRRWLDIEVGYRYRDNDSDADNESYERNVFQVSFDISL